MKKNLSIKGIVELTRKEIVAYIAKAMLAEHGLKVEKVICVDDAEKPVNFQNMICYVHEAMKDSITSSFDDVQKHKVKAGFNRPNRFIGRFLRDLFEDPNKVYTFSEIFKEVHQSFPKMTPITLKKYLTRPEMTGPIEMTGDWYSGCKSKALELPVNGLGSITRH